MKELSKFLREQPRNKWPAYRLPHWDDFPALVHANFPAVIRNWEQLDFDEQEFSNIYGLAQSLLDDPAYSGCLLMAPPGRGKTVCALGIAYFLQSQFSPIYFVPAGTFDPDQIQGVLQALRAPAFKPLVIVDDAHLNADAIIDFLDLYSEYGVRTRWLLASRPSSAIESLSSEIPVLQILPDFSDAAEILKLYFRALRRDSAAARSENVFKAAALPDELVKRIYGDREPPINLSRLGRFFKAWKWATASPIETAENLDQLMWIELEKEFLTEDARPLVLPVAALSSVEVFPGDRYVVRLSDSRTRNALVTNGAIEKRPIHQAGYSYRIVPSDAIDLLRAAAFMGFLENDNVDQYVSATVREYLLGCPPGLGMSLNALRTNAKDVLSKVVGDERFGPVWNRIVDSGSLADFAAVFAVIASASPDLGKLLFRRWLQNIDAPDHEGKVVLAASKIGLLGIWPSRLMLLGLRLSGLLADRQGLIAHLPVERFREDIRQIRISPQAFNLLASECVSSAPFLKKLIVPQELAPLMRKRASGRVLLNVLNLLEAAKLSVLRRQLVSAIGSVGLATIIKRRSINAQALGWLLRWMRDIPGIISDEVLGAIRTDLSRQELSLSQLEFLLRTTGKEEGAERLRASLVPPPSEFPRFLSRSKATDLQNASAIFRHAQYLAFLTAASVYWPSILSRSSLVTIARLEHHLRATAKRIFKNNPGNQSRAGFAERFQDRADDVGRSLNELDWTQWPIVRLKTYRQLLLNAVAIDGIYLHRQKAGVEATGRVGRSSKRARIIQELDLGRSFHLEVLACAAEKEDREEPYLELVNFAWCAIRANAAASFVGHPGLYPSYVEQAANIERDNRTRFRLIGSMLASGFEIGGVSFDLTTINMTIENLTTAIRQNVLDPAANPLPEAFMVLLELTGVTYVAEAASNPHPLLLSLTGPKLEKLFSYFEDPQERGVCELMRSHLLRLQSRA